MSEIIKLQKKNEVFFNVECDMGVGFELNDFFSFFVPGYQHMPLFKMRAWDGKVSLYNQYKQELYIGLYDHIKEFCKARQYTLELVESAAYGLPGVESNILLDDVTDYVNSLKPDNLELREYQVSAIYNAIRYKRKTILSPTASGKSFIIYCITKYILDNNDGNVLIVVPTTSLVLQMLGDFKSYGWNTAEDEIHTIMGGHEKRNNCRVVISTWQSLMKMPTQWFSAFDGVFIDECHTSKSKEMQKLLEKMVNTSYRYGTTGSLDNTKTHSMMIQAVLGPIMKVTTTRKLIDDGHVSDIDIQVVVLDYSKDTKALLKKIDYQQEIDFIVAHDRRNKFLRNLALSMDGNTLLLFNYVDKHGKVLFDMIKEKAGDRNIFFVHGQVEATAREEVRKLTEDSGLVTVTMEFGDKKIEVLYNEIIPLTNGTKKIAVDITVDDDIDTTYLINNGINMNKDVI
jgi:superfamily II DNA or RNA helicase